MIIGLDALDRIRLSSLEDQLPNLKRLKEEGLELKSRCVFPPDTPSAWSSIYTGLNPARHGIVLFVDPLDRITTMAFNLVDNTPIRGRTFWDMAGKEGKKVCILFPKMGDPLWPVNGAMVIKSSTMYSKSASVVTYPASLNDPDRLSVLADIEMLPQKKNYPKYIKAQKELIKAETEYAVEMWQKEDWDLFFVYSEAIDWVGHNFWSYFDENDPTYPGPNPCQDVLLDFYKAYDEMVGRLLAVAGPDTTIIVISDHGQMMRPMKLVNINEILRVNGLLVPKAIRAGRVNPYHLLEFAKTKATEFINRYGIGSNLAKLVHRFPSIKRLYTSPPSIDWQKTAAYITDLSGIKAYSYGGIRVNKEGLGDRDYEETRDLIITELKKIREPSSQQKIIKWICRREELYSGEHISLYPDIVFELREDYGAGWAIHAPIISNCRTHNIQPGSHRGDTPVCLIWNAGDRKVVKNEITLMDIAPTVLNLLNIEHDYDFDGESVLVRKSSR